MDSLVKYRWKVLLVGLLLLSSACSNDNDELPENFTPLNCIIPGELQLNGDTKDILSEYKRGAGEI